ncbi:MAG: MGMT family protein [Leptospira sp.]|nr:MGMT family protein [Leptospira sp.]
MKEHSFYDQVYSIVKQIPKGKVTNYGTIALILGSPRAARAVGYALNAIKKGDLKNEIPWQRVVNAKGQITFKGDLFRANLQKSLLIKEGIIFDSTDTIDFQKYGWPS